MKNLCQIGLDCPFCHYTEDGEPLCTFPDVEPKEVKEYRQAGDTEKGEGMTSPHLMICPFCGSKDISIQTRGSQEYRVMCDDCGIRTPWGILDDAIYGWNRRDPGA